MKRLKSYIIIDVNPTRRCFFAPLVLSLFLVERVTRNILELNSSEKRYSWLGLFWPEYGESQINVNIR